MVDICKNGSISQLSHILSLLTTLIIHYSDLNTSSSSSSSPHNLKKSGRSGIIEGDYEDVIDDVDYNSDDDKLGFNASHGKGSSRKKRKRIHAGLSSSSSAFLYTKHTSLLASWLAHTSYEVSSKKVLLEWLHNELSHDQDQDGNNDVGDGNEDSGCEVGQLLAMKVLIASFAALIRLISIYHMYQSGSNYVEPFGTNPSSATTTTTKSEADTTTTATIHSINTITIGDEIVLRTNQCVQTFLKSNFLTTTTSTTASTTSTTHPLSSSSSIVPGSIHCRGGGSGSIRGKGKQQENGVNMAMCEVVR